MHTHSREKPCKCVMCVMHGFVKVAHLRCICGLILALNRTVVTYVSFGVFTLLHFGITCEPTLDNSPVYAISSLVTREGLYWKLSVSPMRQFLNEIY